MLTNVWTAAVAAVVAGVLALPAPAAYAQTSTAPANPPAAAPANPPAAKPMTMKKPMAHKASHKMSCYDYAYQSAAMQDCLAKGGGKTSAAKPMMKKASKKKTPASSG